MLLPRNRKSRPTQVCRGHARTPPARHHRPWHTRATPGHTALPEHHPTGQNPAPRATSLRGIPGAAPAPRAPNPPPSYARCILHPYSAASEQHATVHPRTVASGRVARPDQYLCLISNPSLPTHAPREGNARDWCCTRAVLGTTTFCTISVAQGAGGRGNGGWERHSQWAFLRIILNVRFCVKG